MNELPHGVIASDPALDAGERGNPVLLPETWGPAYADSSFRRRSSSYGGQVGKAGWIATARPPSFFELRRENGLRDDGSGNVSLFIHGLVSPPPFIPKPPPRGLLGARKTVILTIKTAFLLRLKVFFLLHRTPR